MSRWFRTYGFQEVHDDLLIGAIPTDRVDVNALDFAGVRAVLNLVEDAEYDDGGARAEVELAYQQAAIREARVRITDYGHLSDPALEAAVGIVNRWLDEGRTTYVHCRAGWQRSAAVAAAVMATRTNCDIDEAVALIRARKPSCDPLPHQREDLRRWWHARQRARA